MSEMNNPIPYDRDKNGLEPYNSDVQPYKAKNEVGKYKGKKVKNNSLVIYLGGALIVLTGFLFIDKKMGYTKAGDMLTGTSLAKPLLSDVICIDSLHCMDVSILQNEDGVSVNEILNMTEDTDVLKTITVSLRESGQTAILTEPKKFKNIQDKSEYLTSIVRKRLEEGWNPETRKFGRKKSKGRNFEDTDAIVVTKKDMIPLVTVMMVDEVLYNIPALGAVTAGQADLESYWFNSKLGKKTNNGFGIKYVKTWDKEHNKQIWMVDHREGYKIAHDDIPTDKFIKFKSRWACIRFHTKFLFLQTRYKSCLKQKTYSGWAKGLKDAGYATDRSYTNSLNSRYKVLDIYFLEKLGHELRNKYNDGLTLKQ